MPELPDITVYIAALTERTLGKRLDKVRLTSPFLLRSFEPPLKALEGQRVAELRRIGKRIVFGFGEELFLVLHLMVAGRLRYVERGAKVPGKVGLCAFDFEDATLILTEASKKKRASLHVVRGEAGLKALDPGGIDVMTVSLAAFERALVAENHTLKRTLTDPHVFSGIGNAYSDEILHRAKLSPVKWTTRLSDDEIARLHAATQTVMREWTARLDAERQGGFPTKVTAFRDEMAVHGKYKQPCPDCGAPVQRIVRGENEINYCAPCQTEGKLLADRALSRLLKGDWPKTLEDLEERKERAGQITAPKDKVLGGSDLASRIAAMNKRSAAAKERRTHTDRARVLLLAHGAGAGSSSEWMLGWRERLGALGEVLSFDYPYMKQSRRRPDPQARLLEAHLSELQRAERLGKPVVLIGKSMGGRLGCHLALEHQVAALVCLGYPLISPGKSAAVRDQVLIDTRTPILFVQGTRDKLCPLDQLEEVRARMSCDHRLHVVDSGDHSLLATKAWLKANGKSQADVDADIVAAIGRFLDEVGY